MGQTRSLTVTLETVTPLFLGGADPRGAPELRPPAFRGALRYWLRAALGGVWGDDEAGLSQIRQIEAQVFGSTDEKTSRASTITVRVTPERQLESVSYSQMAAWDAQQRRFEKPGIAYLFFAARGTRQEQERSALLGTFDLIFQARPGVLNAQRHFKKAYAALWLLTHFGGVGNRVHRCGGNLQAIRVVGEDIKPELVITSASPSELVEELGSGLRSVEALLGVESWGNVRTPSGFDILHPRVCQIWVVDKTYARWDEAVDEVGGILQSFRSRRQPDYATVKAAMTNYQSLDPAIQRAAFGLPIPFYYSSLHDGATLRSTHFERRSSPLWIRVVKLTDGRYAVVFLWFRSRFLPTGEELILQKKKKKKKKKKNNEVLSEGPLPGDDLLPLFFNYINEQGVSLLEVHYD